MKPTITLIIGHRGVGKTSLLKRLQNYEELKSSTFLDLDEEIENRLNQKITDIFLNNGENYFRKVEQDILKEICRSFQGQSLYISLGAGCLPPYPGHCEVIWVRRGTDFRGRVFLNRPRLDSKTSAFDESLIKFKERECIYRETADKILTLEEGGFSSETYEREFFSSKPLGFCDAFYTLQKKELDKFAYYLRLGLKRLELRTDILSQQEIEKIIQLAPNKRLLVSIRDKETLKWIDSNSHDDLIYDYPLELGAPEKKYDIISLHDKSEGLSAAIAMLDQFSESCEFLKLAVPINSFKELNEGHAWHLQNPKKNNFLPMSQEGRWQWYRLWQKNNLSVNFVKFDQQGSSQDQPYYYQWVKNTFNQENGFACILGDPIDHSYTPSFHHEFFKKKQRPVLNIPLPESELDQDTYSILVDMGLKCAAITSPLKQKFYQLLTGKDDQTINTLYYSEGGKARFANTDGVGLDSLLKSSDFKGKGVVWGGGGVLPELTKRLPEFSCYSARTARPREGFKVIDKPEVVVWASGRSHHSLWPTSDWKPKKIIDLNYSDDSPGKEYALMVNAEYVSGLEMFTQQAQAQQKFWSELDLC